MLTSNISKRVSIPHEPSEWMTFRMLSGKQLERAREVRMQNYLSSMRGNAEVIRELKSADRDEITAAGAAELAADPLNLAPYDVDALLRPGIVGWSYPEDCTDAAVDDLDETTRAWAAREILALSLHVGDDIKNSIGGSTAP